MLNLNYKLTINIKSIYEFKLDLKVIYLLNLSYIKSFTY